MKIANVIPKIALLLPGGLGEIDSGIHIPRMFDLVRRLSDTFSITAYSHSLPGHIPKTLPCGNAEVRFLGATANSSASRRFIEFLSAVSADHHEKRFDLVHGLWGLPFGFYAVLAGKVLGIPSVVSFLGGESAAIPDIEYGQMRKQPERLLIRWICRHADRVTTLSRYQVWQLHEHGIQRDDWEIIPPGIDCSRYSFSARTSFSPPWRFLHVGDLNRVKDQATLIRAFARISSRTGAVLRIVGRDCLDGAYQRLVHELHMEGQVEFRGYVSHSEIPSHLAWADILLHSSLHEGGSTAVLEAMAAGVLVCGTAVGLLSDLQEECSIASPPREPSQLADRVLDLLNNPERMTALQMSAHRWALENDIRHVVKRHAALYRGLLTANRMPAPHTVHNDALVSLT